MLDKPFRDIEPNDFAGTTVILDVDGTLVADRMKELLPPEHAALERLAAVARVYLCSNARSSERLTEFAKRTGATYIDTPYLKPNPRVMETVPLAAGERVVVIGDKFLTDGILALRIKAEFRKVERIHFRHEPLRVHLAYAIDGIFGRALFYTARLFLRP